MEARYVEYADDCPPPRWGRMCEDCRTKYPHYGLIGVQGAQGGKRWCAGCAREHTGAERICKRRPCEYCNTTAPCYGLPEEKRKRWCSSCAKDKHPEAIPLNRSKMCEDCGLKGPTFGARPAAGRQASMRWCKACSDAHPGAVSLTKRCEDCHTKVPSWGMIADGKTRWCSPCGKKHPGAMALGAKGLEKKRKHISEIRQRTGGDNAT
jgi:hypothetical protein